MTPEEEKELAEHIDAIAKILYRQAQPEQVKTQRIRADRRRSTHVQIVVFDDWRLFESRTTGKALLSAPK